jgi:hypothetical protein
MELLHSARVDARLDRSPLGIARVRHTLNPWLARFLINVAVFVAYIAIGGVLVTHVLEAAGDQAGPSVDAVGVRSARVVVGISVIDGPTVTCETFSDVVTSDVVAVYAPDFSRIYRDLACATPSSTDAQV